MSLYRSSYGMIGLPGAWKSTKCLLSKAGTGDDNCFEGVLVRVIKREDHDFLSVENISEDVQILLCFTDEVTWLPNVLKSTDHQK